MSGDAARKEHAKKDQVIFRKNRVLCLSTPNTESKLTNQGWIRWLNTCLADSPKLTWSSPCNDASSIGRGKLNKKKLKKDFEGKWKERKGEITLAFNSPDISPLLLTPHAKQKGYTPFSCKEHQTTTKGKRRRRREGSCETFYRTSINPELPSSLLKDDQVKMSRNMDTGRNIPLFYMYLPKIYVTCTRREW